jgi:hypothetical protein
MLQVVLGILAVQTLFVLLAGAYMLSKRGWFHRVNHSAMPVQRPRRARKVDQMALCQVSRLALHHDRWFARMSNHRTTEPPTRTGSANDITDQRGYKPLTPKQIEWTEEMFTLNAHLPPDKHLRDQEARRRQAAGTGNGRTRGPPCTSGEQRSSTAAHRNE